MSLQIDEPENKIVNKFSLFALGFRPFFYFAAVFAPLLILTWLSLINGKFTTISQYYSPVGWHAHEMLFGYTVAVIAGFLLTAVGNWTGVKVISGRRLILLSVVFLLGRLAPFITELPLWVIAVSDLLFIPLVAIIIAIPIVRARQWSNIIFVPVLLLMAAANLAVHLSAMNIISLPVVSGSRAMLYLVILLIVIMGGRVIPFFTERGVAGVVTKKWNFIENLLPLSILLLALSDLLYGDRPVTGYVALLTFILHSTRLYGWYHHKIWQVPLVWILQVAYGWFIVGFILKSLSVFHFSESIFSLHAFTVGGIGIMTLGMMARVSLGHTGRDMKINRLMVLSFILINIAAIFRVLVPIFFPESYLQWVQISAWLWIGAFVIFLLVYTPMWVNVRVDGREG
ncbi:MAG: NnrS family protein [Gammaproteobacteria bacterium]|nr:NnrS family protein [Gammaproteobacteria bacterium]